jgi:feruloyl esterase
VPGAYDVWVVGGVQPTSDPNAAGVLRSHTIGGQFVRYFVTKDLNFNPLAFNAAAYQTRIQELSAMFDMTNPDLTAFLCKGWQAHPSRGSVGQGQCLADWVRLLRGSRGEDGRGDGRSVLRCLRGDRIASHLCGTPTPEQPTRPFTAHRGHIDTLGLIDDWVVNGNKPAASLTLTNRSPLPPYDVVASKPMCRYGTYPKFIGSDPAPATMGQATPALRLRLGCRLFGGRCSRAA